MDLSLPFTELRFNIVFWVLITLYGMTGIGNFIAEVPDSTIDEGIFKKNKSNFSLWLLTSLIFYRIGISQFQYDILVYLTLGEIVIILYMYVHTTFCKESYLNKKKRKLKILHRKR